MIVVFTEGCSSIKIMTVLGTTNLFQRQHHDNVMHHVVVHTYSMILIWKQNHDSVYAMRLIWQLNHDSIMRWGVVPKSIMFCFRGKLMTVLWTTLWRITIAWVNFWSSTIIDLFEEADLAAKSWKFYARRLGAYKYHEFFCISKILIFLYAPHGGAYIFHYLVWKATSW